MGSAGHLGVGEPLRCSDGFRSVGRPDLHTEAGYVNSMAKALGAYNVAVMHGHRNHRSELAGVGIACSHSMLLIRLEERAPRGGRIMEKPSDGNEGRDHF